jgi:tetratricopeptide (TPR) repeat protein
MRSSIFILGLCLLLPARLLAQAGEEAVRVFTKVGPSVVALESVASSGTGIIIDKTGHILTNAHVVALPLGFKCLIDVKRGGKNETVTFHNVKVLGVHPTLDLALLKIDPAENSIVLTPGNLLKAKAQTGQRVYAIGNPGARAGVNLNKTITEGLLSGVDRVIDDVPYYQISAAINPGNSGGPLCDRNGNVLGLVTLKLTDLEGVGFAIPLDGLKREDFQPVTARKADAEKASKFLRSANELIGEINKLTAVGRSNTLECMFLRALAIQLYHEALILDPKNASVYSAIGELFAKFEEFERAEAYFVRALELASWDLDPRIYRGYGMMKIAQGKHDEAELLWREGLAKHPTNPRQLWEDLAISYQKGKNHEQAALHAGTALVLKSPLIRPTTLNTILANAAREQPDPAARARIQAQLNELSTDLVRQVLRRNAYLREKRLAITRPFADFMAKKGAQLDADLLRFSPPIDSSWIQKNVNDLFFGKTPAQAAAGGTWQDVGGVWQSPLTPYSGVSFAPEVPAEYDLVLEVERMQGTGELAVAFPYQQKMALFIVDFGGTRSGVAGIRDGLYDKPLLASQDPVSLLIRVRNARFSVSANGREIYSRPAEDTFPAIPAT